MHEGSHKFPPLILYLLPGYTVCGPGSSKDPFPKLGWLHIIVPFLMLRDLWGVISTGVTHSSLMFCSCSDCVIVLFFCVQYVFSGSSVAYKKRFFNFQIWNVKFCSLIERNLFIAHFGNWITCKASHLIIYVSLGGVLHFPYFPLPSRESKLVVH